MKDRFLNIVRPQFPLEIVRVIERAYPAARRATATIDEHLQRNAAGFQRWAIIETELAKLAENQGVDFKWVPNSTGSAFHVELCVSPFRITVSKTDERGRLPDHAEFRKTMIVNTQLRLFDSCEEPGDHVAVFIVHGSNGDPSAPHYVDALFPDQEGQIMYRVDLQGLVREQDVSTIDSEIVGDDSHPQMRTDIEAEDIQDEVDPEIRREDETGTAQ
ncbi:MAG: hypothetical protein IH986_04275 [Planctomycetes bacterium]|nr:hypothetical protein [Planctomycetota bacterium]